MRVWQGSDFMGHQGFYIHNNLLALSYTIEEMFLTLSSMTVLGISSAGPLVVK